MSLATTFFQQNIKGEGEATPEERHQNIFQLGCWAVGFTIPIFVMGKEIKEEEKGAFIKELQELVKKQYNTGINSIEDLFWLIYAAEELELTISLYDREEQLAMFFFRQFRKGNYHDIEEFISAIRLIK